MMKITVCDGSLMSRKSVIRALPEHWSDEVTQCKHGLEAMEACRSGLADVLFLDLTMPIMDGLEVLERLQKEQLTSAVIVISADFQPEVQSKALNLGALAFISKPVSREKLTDTLIQVGLL